MKRIVSTVLAGATLVGSALAADISFSYTGSNFFKSSGGSLKYDNDARTDCMALTIKNDICGVVLDFDISKGELKEDAYYGWLNFGLPMGKLKITAGSWSERRANRVNKDAGKLKDEDFELNKLGVINGTTGKDSNNVTSGNLSMLAEYDYDEGLPGNIIVRAGLTKSSWNPDVTPASTKTNSQDVADSGHIMNSGFAFEAAYHDENLLDFTFTFKSLTKHNNSFAAFISPGEKLVEGLDLTFGYTIAAVQAYDSTAKDWDKWGWEWGFDLRARYEVSEKLSFTTMHNLSSGFNDKNNVDGDTNTWVLWNMVNGTYKIADNLNAGLTLQSVIDGFDKNHSCSGAKLIASPYLAVQATERVSVTTSVRATWTDVNPKSDADATLDVTIPVIFAFSF